MAPRAWVVFLALFLLPLLGQGKPPVDGARLLADLRQGGLILYFRHTATLPEHQHETSQCQSGAFDLAN